MVSNLCPIPKTICPVKSYDLRIKLSTLDYQNFGGQSGTHHAIQSTACYNIVPAVSYLVFRIHKSDSYHFKAIYTLQLVQLKWTSMDKALGVE